MNTQPGDTAPDQVARLLALVPYLLARGEVRLDDAAAHFGTDADQIERDLRLLFMTGLSPGLPGDLIEVDLEALEGDRIIRVDNADYLARPVRFSPAEATSLVVALRTMVEAAPEEARDVIERTLAKLEQAAGQEGEGLLRLHVTPTPLEASAVVPVLESAIAHGHQVEIGYHVPSRDEESQRLVDPRGLARVEDLLYLDAWCHTAQGDRAFRVDRILSATELETPVADPGARARDLTGGWFTDGETTTVTLRLAPPARWVVEYYQVTAQRPGPDGTVDVDLEVASEQWVRSLLLRLAPHATLLAPAHYAEALTAEARATLSLYEDDGVDFS
jgi:proteasome accessory factor C